MSESVVSVKLIKLTGQFKFFVCGSGDQEEYRHRFRAWIAHDIDRSDVSATMCRVRDGVLVEVACEFRHPGFALEQQDDLIRRFRELLKNRAPIGSLLLRMSIPGMVSMIVMSVYNIVDTIWVSGLPNGTEAIAALTVVMPLQMVAAALGMGTGSGVTSLISRRFGETARAMGDAPREIKIRHIGNCLKADPTYGKGVADALDIPLSEVPEEA